jgi:hypothetical protein
MGFTCAESEKDDKRAANRALRRISKISLKDSKEVLPVLREISNVYGFAKDGKQYLTKNLEKYMRK